MRAGSSVRLENMFQRKVPATFSSPTEDLQSCGASFIRGTFRIIQIAQDFNRIVSEGQNSGNKLVESGKASAG